MGYLCSLLACELSCPKFASETFFPTIFVFYIWVLHFLPNLNVSHSCPNLCVIHSCPYRHPIVPFDVHFVTFVSYVCIRTYASYIHVHPTSASYVHIPLTFALSVVQEPPCSTPVAHTSVGQSPRNSVSVPVGLGLLLAKVGGSRN